jgi:hypothetical protein
MASIERMRTGWPKDVMEALLARITNVVGFPFVKQFYIGRTNDTEATKSRHQADAVLALYGTGSTRNAIIVEDNLVHVFSIHPRNINDGDRASRRGDIVGVRTMNYVYLALWYM